MADSILSGAAAAPATGGAASAAAAGTATGAAVPPANGQASATAGAAAPTGAAAAAAVAGQPPAAATGQPATATPPAPPAVAAPEAYALKLPEKSALDAGALARVEAFAREHKLGNDVAQKLLDREDAVVRGVQDASAAQMKVVSQQWADAVRADPDMGGAKFDATVTAARSALDRFADESLKAELKQFGFENHPGLVRMLAKIGASMREDRVIQGAPPAAPSGQLDHAKTLFPNMK